MTAVGEKRDYAAERCPARTTAARGIGREKERHRIPRIHIEKYEKRTSTH